MKNITFKVVLIIGLTALFSISVFATNQEFVVRSSAGGFAFQEGKSLEVQTLLCDGACKSIDATISQEFDYFKIEKLSAGKYRFSKDSDLPVYTQVDLKVAFEVTVGAVALKEELIISVSKQDPKPTNKAEVRTKVEQPKVEPKVEVAAAQADVVKIKRPRKPKKFRTRGQYRAWQKKMQVYYRKVNQQKVALRKKRIKRQAPKNEARTQTQPPANLVAKNDVPTKPIPTPLATVSPSPTRTPKASPSPTPLAPVTLGSINKTPPSSEDVLFWGLAWPLLLAAVILSLGWALNWGKEFFGRPMLLNAARAVSGLFFFGFLISGIELSLVSIALYQLVAVVTFCLFLFQACRGHLQLAIIRREHLKSVGLEKFSKPIKEREFYYSFFGLWDERFKEAKRKFKRVKHEFLKAPLSYTQLRIKGFIAFHRSNKWRTRTIGLGVVVVIALSSAIIMGQDLKKPAPNIINIIPIIRTYEAKQTALSQTGLIAVYEIHYDRKLFDKTNSFDVKPGFAKRPPDGDIQFNRNLWLIGETAIDLAGKYNIRIFTSTQETIEIWSPRNLSKTEFAAIVAEMNAVFQNAFSIQLRAAEKSDSAIAERRAQKR